MYLRISSLNYVDVDSVNKRTARIVNEWDRLGQLSQQRREGIHVSLFPSRTNQ